MLIPSHDMLRPGEKNPAASLGACPAPVLWDSPTGYGPGGLWKRAVQVTTARWGLRPQNNDVTTILG